MGLLEKKIRQKTLHFKYSTDRTHDVHQSEEAVAFKNDTHSSHKG
jgi:hypothetical protein